ncbi:thioredoxin family protein [Planctomycetota bacterium]
MSQTTQKGLVLFVVLLAVIAVLFLREKGTRAQSATYAALETWDAQEDPNAPMLLEFGSYSCPPCKRMFPILQELRQTYPTTLRVLFIDLGKEENLTAGSLHGIQLMPTQIYKDPNGTEIFRHEGFVSKQDIVAKWKELGYPL